MGELAGELALPVKRSWNESSRICQTKEETHLPILSHNYGSVTSISLGDDRACNREGLQRKTARDVRGAGCDSEPVTPISRVSSTSTGFCRAAVTEVGQRLAVDRCNVITPSPDGGFRVSHEYLRGSDLPPGTGLNVPPSLVPTETIKNYLPAAGVTFQSTTRRRRSSPLGTDHMPADRDACRAGCAVRLREELLGVMALHYCREPHHGVRPR